MTYIDKIVETLYHIAGFFALVWGEVQGWVWPFNLAAPFFWEIMGLFSFLAARFNAFGFWVEEVTATISQMLTPENLQGFFPALFAQVAVAYNWVVSAISNVTGVITDWWSVTQGTVQGWIYEAIAGIGELGEQLEAWLAVLQAAWDEFQSRIPTLDDLITWWNNWTGNVLTVVNTWWTGALLEVSALINSAFVERESWWAGWQDWRDQVTEFFTDPDDWLYKSIDRIFERFW